jgi:hypothetical protein
MSQLIVTCNHHHDLFFDAANHANAGCLLILQLPSSSSIAWVPIVRACHSASACSRFVDVEWLAGGGGKRSARGGAAAGTLSQQDSSASQERDMWHFPEQPRLKQRLWPGRIVRHRIRLVTLDWSPQREAAKLLPAMPRIGSCSAVQVEILRREGQGCWMGRPSQIMKNRCCIGRNASPRQRSRRWWGKFPSRERGGSHELRASTDPVTSDGCHPVTFKSDQLGSDGKAVEEAMKDSLDRAKTSSQGTAVQCSAVTAHALARSSKCLCARACHCLG